MTERKGLNQSELDAMQLRLEKLLADPTVTNVKVKVIYQEKHRPGRWEGREYQVLEEE